MPFSDTGPAEEFDAAYDDIGFDNEDKPAGLQPGAGQKMGEQK